MRINSKSSLLIGILFCLGISLPITALFVPALNIAPEINEKRRLAPFPEIDMSGITLFPERFEAYFNDRFGFRNSLLHLNNLIKYRLFKSSGTPKVLVGKNGWLFYTGNHGEDGAPVENQLGILPDSHFEVFKAWKNELETKKKFLAQQGIDYLFVIVPDKWSVYPEFLPAGYSTPDRKSNLDQLLEYLDKNSDLQILDLRKPLIAAKSSGKHLYYKYGTHWNDLGAYYGYRAITKTLESNHLVTPPKELDDFTVTEKIGGGDIDLAAMLTISPYIENLSYNLTPHEAYNYEKRPLTGTGRNSLVYTHSNKSLPRALMFRDSFASALTPYLSEHFSSIVYLWSSWHRKTNIWPLLKINRPQIVIEERAERYMIPKFTF